jgi:pimeloyl-ACP methyl ester carboxylesterase
MNRLLFPDDQQFWFETRRLFGNASYGGTDFGEIMAASETITAGDYDSWYSSYRTMADRLVDEARSAHPVTRRDLLLRASSYAFTAGFFLHGHPGDPRIDSSYDLSVDSFNQAAALFDPAIERVEIPYDDTVLRGYFYPAGGAGPQRTLIMHSGLDGSCQELHFQGAAAGIERGYNVVTFDGPGQPSTLRHSGLKFRPDWEHVITAVIDHLSLDARVDQDRIAVQGMSFGGYLAPRAAAYEPRIAAVVACDGIYDMANSITALLPWSHDDLERRANADHDPELDASLAQIVAGGPTARWAFAHGQYALGVTTNRAFLAELMRYSLAGGVAERITCPTLVCEAEADIFFADKTTTEARRLYDHLEAPRTLIGFTNAEGAGEHCQVGASRLLAGRIYDWLDDVM